MKLAYWMYAGPAHIGVLRVSSSFKNVHAIMHAPLGDDYFNVMRSMLERERDFTPVTASIVDRHVLARGSQEKVVENITRKNKEEAPDLILLTPTCTSSILQEDLHNFVERSIPSMPETNRLSTNLQSETKLENDKTLTTNLTSKKTEIPSSTNLSSIGSLHPARGSSSNSPRSFVTSLTTRDGSPEERSDMSEEEKIEYNLKKPENQSKMASLGQPDVILADVNHYRVNELQAADRTLEQIVRYYIEKAKKNQYLNVNKTIKPSVNIIGIFTLGFHNQHDCRELKRLFTDLGIQINEIIPEGGNVQNLHKLPQAWFNFVPYREVGLMTAVYLKSEFNMPYVSITPMGLIDTAACIREIANIISTSLALRPCPLPTTTFEKKNNQLSSSGDKTIQSGLSFESARPRLTKIQSSNSDQRCRSTINQSFEKYIDQQTRFVSQAAWFSRSIDCQNLTGKKVVVFGDATHSAAMTKILAREMGIQVSCAGTYCKHDADWFREQVNGFCDQILITDDHTQVGDTIAQLEPAAIFGTQMERHVGKRLDIPCGVISAPVHIQNFPLGYRPFLGYEGTNQIADLVYNSFNLGMEDHLLQIFGGHDSVVDNNDPAKRDELPSHQGSGSLKSTNELTSNELWSPEGLAELNKVPGFVRGKVKRNTEKYAGQNKISLITVEVMYNAKEALSTK
jgi:light-independent protochlorophyllide reductase subunit B